MQSLRAKQKFLFQFHCPCSLVDIARRIRESCEIPQRNGSETTSTGIGPTGSSESASRFVAGLLKPRFTYPSAISFPSRRLRVALVIQPASFPDAEGATSLHPWLERRVVERDQSTQSFVGLSGHFYSGDHFLADVTTLFVIDRALFEICFDRNNFVRKFAAPAGQPVVRFASHPRSQNR